MLRLAHLEQLKKSGDALLKAKIREIMPDGDSVIKDIGWKRLWAIGYNEANPLPIDLQFALDGAFFRVQASYLKDGVLKLQNPQLTYFRCKDCKWLSACRPQFGITSRSTICKEFELG